MAGPGQIAPRKWATFLAKKIPSNSSGVGARGDGAKWHAAGRFAPPRNFQSPNISEKRL